jgi:hypothetical protein
MKSIVWDKIKSDLLLDLAFYANGELSDLSLDFTNSCGEGHCINIENETIEASSNVLIIDNSSKANPIGTGWFDFVEDAETHQIYYFWLFLSGDKLLNKKDCKIPEQIWFKLSEKSRTLLGSPDYSDKDLKDYYSKLKKVNNIDYKQFDVVQITAIKKPINKSHITGSPGYIREPQIGDKATIVEIYNNQDTLGFELESVDKEGHTNWLYTCTKNEIDFI